MVKILGISGSLRSRSLNSALLAAARAFVPPDVELDVATLHGIPLYDGDVEQREGLPPAVTLLKERVVGSDGILLATPRWIDERRAQIDRSELGYASAAAVSSPIKR